MVLPEMPPEFQEKEINGSEQKILTKIRKTIKNFLNGFNHQNKLKFFIY
jgi:hypothetical protein